jgi:hypothetical protein
MSAIGVFNKNLVCSPRNRYNFGRASAKVNALHKIGEEKQIMAEQCLKLCM